MAVSSRAAVRLSRGHEPQDGASCGAFIYPRRAKPAHHLATLLPHVTFALEYPVSTQGSSSSHSSGWDLGGQEAKPRVLTGFWYQTPDQHTISPMVPGSTEGFLLIKSSFFLSPLVACGFGVILQGHEALCLCFLPKKSGVLVLPFKSLKHPELT